MKISLVIITDGAHLDNLRRTIASAKPLDPEVVIVYQGVSDTTYTEIQKLSDFSICVSPKGNADPDRNFAYELVSGEWILALDDDEYLPPETVKFIQRITKSKVQVVWFRFKNLVDNVDIEEILGPDPHPRLWTKTNPAIINWPPQAHTFPQIGTQLQYVSVDACIVHDRKYEDILARHETRVKAIDPQQQEVEKRWIEALKKKLGKQ